MKANEKQVDIAARMYECRAVARQLLGDKYQEKMRQRVLTLKTVIKLDKCSEIVAVQTVIKLGGLDGMQTLMLMAAVVEMVEASNAASLD